MSLRGKVVWVTGASSGIGAQAALEFAKEGCEVILSARRTEQLEALRERSGKRDSFYCLPVDLTDSEALQKAVEDALSWRGRVDVLVNNAGISQRATALDTDLESVRRLMELNFFAPVALTQAVLPSMLERGDGRIVVVSSVAGFVGTPLRSTYCASKHAIQGWFDSVRAELHGTGVSVTIVAPGYVATEITRSAVGAKGEVFGKISPHNAKGITAEKCARTLVNATAKRKREVLVGGKEVFAVYLKRWCPGLVARFVPWAAPK